MERKKIVIAIDGYSSCGKSTFAKAIAAKLGYLFVDSGAMYRVVTLFALRNNLLDKEELLTICLEIIDVQFVFNPDLGRSEAYLNGENVDDLIRTIEINENVSKISAIPSVRAKLCDEQQKMGLKKGIVMDGRDIGTTVFPNAELKIFMTASPEVRAERRYAELVAKGDDTTLEATKQALLDRDYQDENRKESPLRKADDAIVLDNSEMSVVEQMEWVENIINKLTLC